MPYKLHLFDQLTFVIESIDIVSVRFKAILKPEDFINSSQGEILLDAITIRLQAIGEKIKKTKTLYPEIFQAYNEIDWDAIIKFRDLISHHYELLNYQVVFNICQYNLADVRKEVEKILIEIS